MSSLTLQGMRVHPGNEVWRVQDNGAEIAVI